MNPMGPQLPFRPGNRPPGARWNNSLLDAIQRASQLGGTSGEDGPAGPLVAPVQMWDDQGPGGRFLVRLTSKFEITSGIWGYHWTRVSHDDDGTYNNYAPAVTDDTGTGTYYTVELNNNADVPTDDDLGSGNGTIVEIFPAFYGRAFWFKHDPGDILFVEESPTLADTTLTGTTTVAGPVVGTGPTFSFSTGTMNLITFALNATNPTFTSTQGTFTLSVPVISITGGIVTLTSTYINNTGISTVLFPISTSLSNLPALVEIPTLKITGVPTSTFPANTYPELWNAVDGIAYGGKTDGTYATVGARSLQGLQVDGAVASYVQGLNVSSSGMSGTAPSLELRIRGGTANTMAITALPATGEINFAAFNDGFTYKDTFISLTNSSGVKQSGASGTAVFGDVFYGGIVKTIPTHPVTAGSAPTGTAGAGAGSIVAGTVTVTGNDVAGYISVTCGTVPVSTGIIATISFASSFGSTPKSVIVMPRNANAGGLSGLWIGSVSSASWDLVSGSGTLTASQVYEWYYLVIG